MTTQDQFNKSRAYLVNLGYSFKVAEQIILQYGEKVGLNSIGRPDRLFEAGGIIQNDWDAFIKYYAIVKNKFQTKRVQKIKHLKCQNEKI
jgi:hypothetical protein